MSRDEIVNHIDDSEKDILASSGMDISEQERSASFLQKDNKVVFSRSIYTRAG